jgi:hypothetical protein
MGNLSNLYISQSFISLIHLGSDNTASVTPTELQDGLGNGVGVSFSTNKNLYVSGNIYAANLTGSGGNVDTSSLVTTASFNAYTQSTNTFTASISTSVGLLQTFSSSQYKTDSASFSSRIISAENTGYVTTASFNTYTSSQDFKNTTFATTSSNTFTATNTFQQGINISGQTVFSDGVLLNTFSLENISGSLEFNKISTASKVDFKNLSLLVSGAITASGDISSSGNIYAANLTGSAGNISVQDEGTILGNATSL